MLLNIKRLGCAHPGRTPSPRAGTSVSCEPRSPPWPGPSQPGFPSGPRSPPRVLPDPARLLALQGVSGGQSEWPGGIYTSHGCTFPNMGTRAPHSTDAGSAQRTGLGRGDPRLPQGLCLAALPFGKPQTSLPDTRSSAQVLGDQGSGWAPHSVLGHSRVTACREGTFGLRGCVWCTELVVSDMGSPGQRQRLWSRGSRPGPQPWGFRVTCVHGPSYPEDSTSSGALFTASAS